MKRLPLFLTLLLILVLAAPLGSAAAQEDDCHAVLFLDARARPSVTTTGAVYGLLVNLGNEDVTLTGGSTDAAEVVEIHAMSVGEDDVMVMEPLPDGIVVPARSYVLFAPGGLHMMLINLTDMLAEGGMLDLTLDFADMDSMRVMLPVSEPEDDMDMSDGGDMEAEMSGDAMQHSINLDDIPEACHGLHVLRPWARPSVTTTGAGYALILNLTQDDDILLGGSTDAAEVVEIHSMTMGEGNIMMMEPLPDGLPIPAGGYVLLQPGGYHVMLIGLTEALEAGATLDITLNFANAGEVTLSFPVQEPDAMPIDDECDTCRIRDR